MIKRIFAFARRGTPSARASGQERHGLAACRAVLQMRDASRLVPFFAFANRVQMGPCAGWIALALSRAGLFFVPDEGQPWLRLPNRRIGARAAEIAHLRFGSRRAEPFLGLPRRTVRGYARRARWFASIRATGSGPSRHSLIFVEDVVALGLQVPQHSPDAAKSLAPSFV